MKSNTVEFYMAQDYPVEIRAISEDLGGGYSASIPCLGRWAFYAVGDTVEEALAELTEVKRALFEDMISRGQSVALPPPLPEDEAEEYSGRILLRMPKDLHRQLAKRAEANGCSINQYAVAALAKQVSGEECAEETAASVLRRLSPQVSQELWRGSGTWGPRIKGAGASERGLVYQRKDFEQRFRQTRGN